MEDRRKTIVINKKFQHHYATVLVAVSVLLLNLLLIGSMLLPGEQRLHLGSTAAMAIGLVELILVLGIWYFSLRATHRIAGPVYVISRELAAFSGGDLSARIRLREGDMFQDEAARINASLEQLQGRVQQLEAIAAELSNSQAGGGERELQLQQLAACLDTLRTREEA